MTGIYIYCLTKKSVMNGFKAKGIEGQSISTIDYKDIMALIHPYESDCLIEEDANRIIDLAMIHHDVVEKAWDSFGTLIPLRFGSIIQGENREDALNNVKIWMEKIYTHIQRRFEDLKDKAEYGIQIFWPNDGLMKKVAKNNVQVKEMEKKIGKSKKMNGLNYKEMHKSLIQRYIAKEIVHASRFLFDRVRPYLEDFQIEKITGGESDRRMLLNISCLLSEEQINEIKNALEEIQGEDGYVPYLSGPWPPYSFARLDDNLCPRKSKSFHVKPGGRVSCV